MVFKRVTSPAAGDASHYGGIDINKIADYLGGTDIAGSETVDINTLTHFRDQKVRLANPANTWEYILAGSAIAANRTITLPLLTGNDTAVTAAFTQTLSNKTMVADVNTLGMMNTYKYTISKRGSNYVAVNNDTGVVDSTNTNPRTVIQFAIDAVNTAGGGSIFFRANTIYGIISNLNPKNNVCLVGEDRMTTVFENNTSTSMIVQTGGGFITGFGMMNITCRDIGTGTSCAELIDFNGTQDCYFYNCRFMRTNVPTDDNFLVYFGDGSKAQINRRVIFVHNRVSGSTSGQDMVGGGEWFDCDFSHNEVDSGDGQGIAFNAAIGCTINNNIFNSIGNAIGAEDECTANTYCNNILINCSGYIKLSGLDITTMFSTACLCQGNIIYYGSAGIQDGHGIGDIIKDNIIYRTQRTGIEAALERSTVSGNHFIETNYSGAAPNVTGTNDGRAGGVELVNNSTGWVGNKTGNVVHDNVVWRTNVAFTVPTGFIDGGQSRTGLPGGVMISSNCVDTSVYENSFNGLETGRTVIDAGANTRIWNNIGYTFENIGLGGLPSRKKVGSYMGFASTVSATAGGTYTGLLASGVRNGAGDTNAMNGVDTTHGRSYRRTTAATAGSTAGWRLDQNFTHRGFNPRLKAKFKLVQTGNQRLYIGFSDDVGADPPNSDDPLNAKRGAMLFCQAADTVFKIAHNDGTGTTVVDAVTGNPAIDTNVHTIEIFSNINGWAYSFDGGSPTYITDTPGVANAIGVLFMIQASTTTAKSLDQYWLEVESDH